MAVVEKTKEGLTYLEQTVISLLFSHYLLKNRSKFSGQMHQWFNRLPKMYQKKLLSGYGNSKENVIGFLEDLVAGGKVEYNSTLSFWGWTLFKGSIVIEKKPLIGLRRRFGVIRSELLTYTDRKDITKEDVDTVLCKLMHEVVDDLLS